VNPRVIGLPRHNLRLFPEAGCFVDRDEGTGVIEQRECGTLAGKVLETRLDRTLFPIKLTEEMDEAFDDFFERTRAKDEELKLGRIEHFQYPPGTLDDLPPGPPVNFSDHGLFRVKEQVLSSRRANGTQYAHKTSAASNLHPPRIPVVLWPYVDEGSGGNPELKHMEENGIAESPFLYFSDDIYDFHQDVVWIGDTNVGLWEEWCVSFLEVVMKAKKRRSENGLPLSWPIFIVDWTDYPIPMRCRIVEQAVGKEFVHYSHRSVIEARKWNEEKGWVDSGFFLDSDRLQNITYRHTPLIVRTDTVEMLDVYLRSRLGLNLSYPVETLERPIDVAHLWPADGAGVGTIESELRTKVSNIVLDMANSSSGTMKVYVGLAGLAIRHGRNSVKMVYVKKMLKSKIVVVTQRDQWEDHYRLFEALTSGAMVLMDRMLSQPVGLEDGKSVVEFSSEAELRTKIRHYLDHPDERLAIAREGRRVAMSRHRSWHRIEEIIFGETLSRCSADKGASSLVSSPRDCPYTVHADR